MENHPDIVAAKAKVARDEAKLNATRLEVARQLIALRSDYDVQRGAIEKARLQVDRAEVELESTRRLVATAAAAATVSQTAGLQLAETRQNLIDASASSRGSRPSCASCCAKSRTASANPGQMRNVAVQTPCGPFVEKLRQALETKITFDLQGTPLEETLEFLRDRTGIPLLRDKLAENVAVQLKLENTSLGAVLQAIEDQTNTQFVVRDYGLVLTSREEARKQGYLPLSEFPRAKADSSARSILPGKAPSIAPR